MQSSSVTLDTLYFGTPVALASTTNPDGTTNLSPISSYWALSNTVVMGISKAGRCYQNLTRHPEAVLNLPDASLWKNVEAIAATTGCEHVPERKVGMGYRHVADKFHLANVQPSASRFVRPQRVRECPIQVELELVRLHQLELDMQSDLIAAELRAVCVHAHTDLVTPQGRIAVERWKPLYYVFRHYCTLGAWLGKNFRAT
ncbi:flavin reductase family protein [Oxalobacteraceae bacterium OM1]|nr:flavin reductase family protein [Oxalobacteraceae bacterium OM1]